MLLQVEIVIVRFAIKLYNQDNKFNELVSTAHCLIQSIKDKLPQVLYIKIFMFSTNVVIFINDNKVVKLRLQYQRHFFYLTIYMKTDNSFIYLYISFLSRESLK